MRFTTPRSLSTSTTPPARSCTSAGSTTSAHTRPSVSTARNRLRPLIFFPRVHSPRAALLGRLHRLAVEDGGRELGPPAILAADLLAQRVVKAVPGAVALPGAEVVEHDPVAGQVVRQGAPSAAVAGLIKDGVDDLAPGVLRGASARFGTRNIRFDPTPLVVREVGQIGHPAHAQMLGITAYWT